MLDLAFVLTLAAQCAPDVSPRTLAAIAHTESRFDPLAIGVNNGPAVSRQGSITQATATARRLIAEGRNIDLGLAQINSANLGWLNLSVEAAFNPCRNLEAAATVLLGGYAPRSTEPAARQQALRVALSRYNTGHPQRGFLNGYVGRVEASAVRLGLAAPLALPPMPEAALQLEPVA
ncbi:lytic transglycosylase domain-containing protein, partial [Brevundimonas sp.]|uniref:lytic transglycosylase domain-containing protein n=1 Tax=Brevundimonas sp. TaxID=1871086 RepID=UPI0028999B35